MRSVLWSCVVLAGCAGASKQTNPAEAPPDENPAPTATFVPLDSTFKSAPRAELPLVVLDERELEKAPPFKAVGVLQMEGKETKRLKAFYEAVGEAGAQMGCDVLFQRDAFELGTRIAKPRIPGGGGIGLFIASSGRVWHRSDDLAWQFLCGVNGATDQEQEKSVKAATRLAVDLRRKALGHHEPCDPYVPLGSHIYRRDVCADDPKKHNVAAGQSTNFGR